MEEPVDVVAYVAGLRRGARRSRRGHWFPLMTFGVLGLGAAPLYARAGDHGAGGQAPSARVVRAASPLRALGGAFTGHPQSIALAWLLGVPLVCLLTWRYYRRQARRVGVSTSVKAFTAVAVGIDVLLLVMATAPHPSGILAVTGRGLLPYLAIAFATAALAWSERSPRLAAASVGLFAVTVLVSSYDTENLLYRLGLSSPSLSTGVVNAVLPGLYLVLTGTFTWAMSRRRS